VTRVLVAAVSSVVRAGLESLVRGSPTLMLAGSSPGVSVSTVAQHVDELQAEVVLIELDRRDEEAISELLTFAAGSQSLAIVLLATDTQGTWVVEALRSGVRAILPSEATAEEIVATVEAAAAGLMVLHSAVIETVLSDAVSVRRSHQPAPGHDALTAREIEVLGMMAEGLSNKEIAWRLHISEHTVKFHVGSLFAKLNASSRTEAVTLGIRQGLIMI
jgi:two-component system, NarL family, response regulator YdfI